MWVGVLSGLAILKFSGSPIKKGDIKEDIIRNVNIKINLGKSFAEKNGWKFIVSVLLFLPVGLLDPVV